MMLGQMVNHMEKLTSLLHTNITLIPVELKTNM